jgi:DNA-binding NarL/FixJ family response regulator
MPDDNRKRIILIDDHMLLRQGLERLFKASGEFVVCEETGTAAEGTALIREMRPDGAIVDVSLPDADGIELTRKLLSEFPGLVVLVLSMHEGTEMATRAMEAGAMGYVLKDEAIDGLLIALRNAFNGKRHFSADVLKDAS